MTGWVWFKENAELDVPQLDKFLGMAETSANIISYYVVSESGKPVTASTVQRVTVLEQQTDANKQKMNIFSEKIAHRFKEPRLLVEGGIPSLEDWEDILEEDDGFAEEFHCLYDNTDVPEADDEFDPDTYNHYLKMEVSVKWAGHEHSQFARRLTKRFKDHRGNPTGTAYSNPILDTRMYTVKFAARQLQTSYGC